MWIAVTKILARKGPLADGIDYILNEEKTDQLLTVHLNCDPGREVREMLDTKRAAGPNGKMVGVQYYHIVQSFKPGEVTPELALEIAKEFAEEHLPGYEAVIAVHVDKEHIHAHTIFNSVNADTGRKYHSNAKSYYNQIRAVSDRLCREHGLSVIMEGQSSQAVRYIAWLRQSKGQPTFRSMLEADLRTAIEDANGLGRFFLPVPHDLLGQLFQTGRTAFTGIIWINDMKGFLDMMLIHEIPFPVDTGSCRTLSCLIEQDGEFIGVDAPTGKLHVWSEAGNAAELELPRRYEKLVCSPNDQRYFAISRCAPGNLFILDHSFRELDRIRIRTEDSGACVEDIWFEEESGLLWLVFSGAVCRFSTAGDCLGAFMTAPQGTQYQALCTNGDHLYLAYQKGGCAYVSVYSRQGAHLEGISLGGEYVVRNWLSAEKSGGTGLRVFAAKGLGFPCILELQPGTPPPSRFLSVECFSETSQLRATCHVDSPAGQ